MSPTGAAAAGRPIEGPKTGMFTVRGSFLTLVQSACWKVRASVAQFARPERSCSFNPSKFSTYGATQVISRSK